jgi:hypothetical protein
MMVDQQLPPSMPATRSPEANLCDQICHLSEPTVLIPDLQAFFKHWSDRPALIALDPPLAQHPHRSGSKIRASGVYFDPLLSAPSMTASPPGPEIAEIIARHPVSKDPSTKKGRIDLTAALECQARDCEGHAARLSTHPADA